MEAESKLTEQFIYMFYYHVNFFLKPSQDTRSGQKKCFKHITYSLALVHAKRAPAEHHG